MSPRRLLASALIGLVAATCAAAAEAREAPRFSLSATTAVAGDIVELRASSTAGVRKGTRLYLVARTDARAVRSRFDPRLSFIGSLGASRTKRLAFTVPPLEPGRYVVVYSCAGCLPTVNGVIARSSPTLRVSAALGEGCPTTRPNGKALGATAGTWTFHGNGQLAVLLPRKEAHLTTNSLGGYKMFWIGKDWSLGEGGSFGVRYQQIDPPSAPVSAVTVGGSLGGYDGPSWASRMSFEPGCWQITGRIADVSLGFVVDVVRGSG